jgi:hypothetical protein
MNNDSPENHYPIEQFAEDLRWVFESAARLSVQERRRHFYAYYRQTYPDDLHYFENHVRLLACADYLLSHLQEFTVEHWMEQSGDSCWISHHLIGAAYRLFSVASLEHLANNIPISMLLDLADEQKRLFPKMGED